MMSKITIPKQPLLSAMLESKEPPVGGSLVWLMLCVYQVDGVCGLVVKRFNLHFVKVRMTGAWLAYRPLDNFKDVRRFGCLHRCREHLCLWTWREDV